MKNLHSLVKLSILNYCLQFQVMQASKQSFQRRNYPDEVTSYIQQQHLLCTRGGLE